MGNDNGRDDYYPHPKTHKEDAPPLLKTRQEVFPVLENLGQMDDLYCNGKTKESEYTPDCYV